MINVLMTLLALTGLACWVFVAAVIFWIWVEK